MEAFSPAAANIICKPPTLGSGLKYKMKTITITGRCCTTSAQHKGKVGGTRKSVATTILLFSCL
jgi:hypothetical protein